MIYLLIEFLDELVFGVGEIAWPLIRDDLQLTYTEIGLLLSLPGMLGALIEPLIGVLGDVWRRRALILLGGVFFAASLFMTSLSTSFLVLLISFMLFYPSSGAYVSLSQASLMDSDPRRHEQNMARWTLAGSVGIVAGPVLLGLLVYLGLGWRGTYALLASIASLSLLAALRYLPPQKSHPAWIPSFSILFDGFRSAFAALKRREVWRWLLLLEFSDLMMDVLLGYMALYYVDVGGATEAQAGIAVTIWLVLGLLTDFAFIRFIDRRPDSVQYLRYTAVLELLAFAGFLIVPGFIPKVIALVLVGLFHTGWYPILQGRLYSNLPGQSASIMAIGAVTTPLAKIFPLAIGLLADQVGLQAAMWLLILGPIALLVGLPRRESATPAVWTCPLPNDSTPFAVLPLSSHPILYPPLRVLRLQYLCRSGGDDSRLRAGIGQGDRVRRRPSPGSGWGRAHDLLRRRDPITPEL